MTVQNPKQATQCPRCGWRLGSAENSGPQIWLCNRCDGKFLVPKELADQFSAKASPQQWVEDQFAAMSVRQSVLHCPHDDTQLNAYTLVLTGRHLTLRHCDQCEGIWLDKTESQTLGHLLRLRAAALKKSNQALSSDTGYLFQLFSIFPMGLYFSKRKRPLAVGVTLFLYFLMMLHSSLNLDLLPASSDFMLMLSSFFLGEQPWAILSYASVPTGTLAFLCHAVFWYLLGYTIEDRYGTLGYLQVLLMTSLAGAFGFIFVQNHFEATLAGPQFMISGLVGAYLVLFRKKPLWVRLRDKHFLLPVTIIGGVWIISQSAFMLVQGALTDIFGHVASLILGISVARLMKRTWPIRQRLRY